MYNNAVCEGALIIGYKKVNCAPIVSVHETDEVFLVECANVDTWLIVESVNEIRVLDDKHPLRLAFGCEEVR